MPSWKEIILAALDDEVPPTRATLQAIPDEHLDWRPHDKSWPLGQLAGHLANVLRWQGFVLDHAEFDLATIPPPDTESVGNNAETVAIFDANVEALRSKLSSRSDDDLEQPWTLRRGEHTLFALPRHDVIRKTGIRHLIHHRAQIGMYLRLLDLPVPPTYGPTADSGPPGGA